MLINTQIANEIIRKLSHALAILSTRDGMSPGEIEDIIDKTAIKPLLNARSSLLFYSLNEYELANLLAYGKIRTSEIPEGKYDTYGSTWLGHILGIALCVTDLSIDEIMTITPLDELANELFILHSEGDESIAQHLRNVYAQHVNKSISPWKFGEEQESDIQKVDNASTFYVPLLRVGNETSPLPMDHDLGMGYYAFSRREDAIFAALCQGQSDMLIGKIICSDLAISFDLLDGAHSIFDWGKLVIPHRFADVETSLTKQVHNHIEASSDIEIRTDDIIRLPSLSVPLGSNMEKIFGGGINVGISREIFSKHYYGTEIKFNNAESIPEILGITRYKIDDLTGNCYSTFADVMDVSRKWGTSIIDTITGDVDINDEAFLIPRDPS